MTGFAAAGRESDAGRVQVTIKSVNHRFLDVALKMPSALGSVEQRVRGHLQQRLARGRIELSLLAEITTTPEREVVIDWRLLDQIAAAIESVREKGLVTGTMSVSDVFRLPQVFDIRSRPGDATTALVPELLTAVDEAVVEAIEALVAMRDTEGRLIGHDLSSRVATMAGFVDELERLAQDGQAALEERLRERLAALPADLQADPVAVAQEIVRFASRSDIDEELVRLRAHFEHWRSLAEGPEACGRKLDFLVQEMNREINTIGSKVEGSRGTAVVIDAKAELERIREQAQNVE